jgi:CelD/BcsL family acetyltransferase involved in cellulose biosynthesis
MHIAEISKYEDFLRLEPEWNELLREHSDEKPFYMHQWFRIWWDSFGAKRKLHVLVATKDHRVLAIAPLMISRRFYMGFPMRVIEFMANDHSPKIDLIFPRDNTIGVEKIIDHLLERENWDLLKLEDILESSPVINLIEKRCNGARLLWGKRTIRFSPYISIQSDWNSFVARLSRKFRKNMRNRQRHLGELGDFRIEEHSRIDDLDGLLAQLHNVTQRSWQGRRGSSVFSTKENLSFYVKLARWANQEGYLVLWLLRLNSTPIAYEYHLRSGQTEFALKAEYDERFKQDSPGGVLDQSIVESLFNRGFKKYDLLGYDDPYKMCWTESVHKHLRYYILRKRVYAHMPFWLDFRLRDYLRRFKILRQLKKAIWPNR